MEAAESGDLLNRDGLAGQIGRMLASPKALNLSESFAHQWLGLANIDGAADDPQRGITSKPASRFSHIYLPKTDP